MFQKIKNVKNRVFIKIIKNVKNVVYIYAIILGSKEVLNK